MIESLQTVGERSRICSRCHKLHLTENNYCEHCLFEFGDDYDNLLSRF